MPWSVKNPPNCAKNWSQEEKRKCVNAANKVLKESGSETQAIRACIHAAGKTRHPGGKSSLSLATQSRAPLGLNPLPFAGAIASARRRGVVLPDVYYGQLTGLARALAFTVSRLATVDQIDRVLKELTRNLEEGNTLADFKRKVEQDPDILSLPRGRVETIYRNGVQTAYNRGRAEFHIRHKQTRPFLLYSAINDSRVRPAHLRMNGVIAPVDHPVWHKWYPPSGHRCLLPGTEVRGDFEIGLKSFYSGPAVEIEFDSGTRLSVTANHPIATPSGIVPAHSLKEGSDCLGDRLWLERQRFPLIAGIVGNEQRPTAVENLFEAMRLEAVGIGSPSAFDFHDDMIFRKGDIKVAGSKGMLMHGVKPQGYERFQDRQFICTDDGTIAHSANSQGPPLMAILSNIKAMFSNNAHDVGFGNAHSSSYFRHAIDGILNQLNHVLFQFFIQGIASLPGSRALAFDKLAVLLDGLPFEQFRCALSPGFNSLSMEESRYSGTAHTIELSKCIDALTVLITLNDRLGIGRRPLTARNWSAFADSNSIGHIARLNSSITQQSLEQTIADALGFEQRSHINPSLISIDKVRSVRNFSFSGHVYDFQTETGLFIANGIITHNCRCSVISLTREEAERRGITVDIPDVNPDPGWDHSVLDDPDLALKDAAAAKRQSVDPQLVDLVPEGPPPKPDLDEMITRGGVVSSVMFDAVARAMQPPGRVMVRLDEDEIRMTMQKALADALADADRPTYTPAKIKGSGKGKEVVGLASTYYPDTWTAKADAMGPLRVRFDKGRVWQISIVPGAAPMKVTLPRPYGVTEVQGGDGFITANNLQNALHEYAHRLQATIPELDDYFQQLHEKRTAGEAIEKLADITKNPNYRDYEEAKRDAYINPYMGKEYKPSPNTYTGRSGALELMAMSMDGVLGMNTDKFLRLLREDRELFDLAVGLLMHYDP